MRARTGLGFVVGFEPVCAQTELLEPAKGLESVLAHTDLELAMSFGDKMISLQLVLALRSRSSAIAEEWQPRSPRPARRWCRIGRATRREPESACLLRRMWCHGQIRGLDGWRGWTWSEPSPDGKERVQMGHLTNMQESCNRYVCQCFLYMFAYIFG